MSPLAFHRKLYTPVRINPPYLTYLTQPEDPATIGHNGSVSVTGLATANYFTTGIGTIGYEWKDGNGSIVGVGTTLTLNNLVAQDDNGKELTQYAIYYPDPTRVGIETFQPGASNSPLASDTITLSVQADITITQQPDAVGQGDLSQASINISPNTPNGTSSISLTGSNTFGDFASDQEYTLTPLNDYRIQYILGGAGGGSQSTGTNDVLGGKGGQLTGEVYMKKGLSYKLVVGKAGQWVINTTSTGGKGGGGTAYVGNGGEHEAGSGGGYTGVFETSVTQSTALLIAGGGGGGGYWSGDSTYSAATGGSGGGEIGGGGSVPVLNREGEGGTQTAGGSGGGYGTNIGGNGSDLQGGNNSNNDPFAPGGAGGGGYYGGGAGGSGSSGDTVAGGGGGGSGFINSDSTKVVNGVYGVATNTSGGTVSISLAS